MSKTTLDPNQKTKLYIHYGKNDGIGEPKTTNVELLHGVRVKNIKKVLGKRVGFFRAHITVGSWRKKEEIKFFKLTDLNLN